MKCNRSRPGFELVSPRSFPTAITTTPRAPPQTALGESCQCRGRQIANSEGPHPMSERMVTAVMSDVNSYPATIVLHIKSPLSPVYRRRISWETSRTSLLPVAHQPLKLLGPFVWQNTCFSFRGVHSTDGYVQFAECSADVQKCWVGSTSFFTQLRYSTVVLSLVSRFCCPTWIVGHQLLAHTL